MNRGRRRGLRWLAAALALLFACAGLPAFAEDAAVPAISPTEKTLEEGRKLTEIAFTAKDGEVTLSGSFAWASGVPFDRALTREDSGTYTVIFTPEPAKQNGKIYSEAWQAVAVTVEPKESPGPAYDTASAVTEAVRAISGMTDDEVRRIAEAVRALSGREQDRLSRSTLEKLDAEYCKRFGYTHETTVDVRDDGVSSNRIPRGSHAYGVASATGGNRVVKLYQQKPSGSSVLQFELEVDGSSASLPAPIVVYVALPGNISSSRDYYLKSPDGEISASVSRDYLAFTTSTLGRFRLYRERSSSWDDDDDDDDWYRYRSRNDRRDYVVTSFWESVIDAVHDAKEGDRLRVNIGTRTEIPADLLRELKGRRVMLVLRPTRGESVTIRGQEVVSIPASRDYYTMNNLLSLYERGDRFDDPAPVSSASAPAVPAAPAVTRPPAAYTPTVPAYTPPAASSASSEPAASVLPEPSGEEPLPDVEIAAEEDDPPESSAEEPAKPQEPTGGAENPFGLAVFAAAAVAVAALLSCVLTLVIWGARRRRGR